MTSSKKSLHSISDIDGSIEFKSTVSLSCMILYFNIAKRSNEEDTFLIEGAYSSGDNKIVVEVETKLNDWRLLLLLC